MKKATLHDNYVSTMALHGDQLITGSFDQCIIWSDCQTGRCIRAINAHEDWVRKLVICPDGKQIVSVGDDMLVKVWDTATGKLMMSLAGHERKTPEGYLSALYTVAVSPDGKQIASAIVAGFRRRIGICRPAGDLMFRG